MSNVISASHLTLAYDNGTKEIIKDANFRIKKGEFVFITGPSGSGKRTIVYDFIDKVFTEIAGYNPTIKPLLDKPVGVHSRYCDMSLVKEKFGWMPKISLEEGMRRVYEAAKKKM